MNIFNFFEKMGWQKEDIVSRASRVWHKMYYGAGAAVCAFGLIGFVTLAGIQSQNLRSGIAACNGELGASLLLVGQLVASVIVVALCLCGYIRCLLLTNEQNDYAY